jgi:hypothetical protein
MPLLPEDAQYLTDRGIAFGVSEEGGMTCLLLPDWPLPVGLSAPRVDLLIRLSPGYPDVAPDMWWVDPPLQRSDGAEIVGTQAAEPHLGRIWQRWSRHFEGGQWQPGADRLRSYIALLEVEFRRAAGNAA